MRYAIDNNALFAFIDEQVSQVAEAAYGENGASLYDSVVLTEKDTDDVMAFIGDAVRAFASRTFDICRISPADGQGREGLEFYVPDFDTTMQDAAFSEITHYIVFSVCASLFQSRRAQEVQNYATRAQASMDRAVSLLKSRKSPMDIW